MTTVQMLTRSATVLTLCLGLVGCAQPTPEATATERELCIQWRDSLPTRSKADTEQTQAEIGLSYDLQAAACPAWAVFQ